MACNEKDATVSKYLISARPIGIYHRKSISYMVIMTTISVTEDVKEKLLKIASELQIKLGKRVDLNEAIRFLIGGREKKPQLLEEGCKPIPGAEETLEELYAERKRDEERVERKIIARHKRDD